MASVRLIIPLLFTAQVTLASGLSGWVAFTNGQKSARELTVQLANRAIEHTDTFLDYYFGSAQPMLETTKSHFLIHHEKFFDLNSLRQLLLELQPYWATGGPYGNAVSGVVYANSQRQFTGLYFLGKNNWRLRVIDPQPVRLNRSYFLNQQGEVLSITDESFVYDPRQRPYYQAVVKAGKPVWSEVYMGFAKQELQITATAPLYDPQGKLKGVVGADVSLEEVSDFLKSLEISASGVAFIVEPSGKLVATSRSEPLFSLSMRGELQRPLAINSTVPLIQKTAARIQQEYGGFQSLQNQPLEFTESNKRYFGQVHTLADVGLNWKAIVVIPETDFMGNVIAHSQTTLSLLLGLWVVSITGGYLTARWLVEPLLTLSGVATSIEAEKELNSTVKKKLKQQGARRDEFGQLARIFTSMGQEVRARTQALRAEIQKLSIEIDHQKKEQQVKEIVETEFFQELKAKAQEMRSRHKRGED